MPTYFYWGEDDYQLSQAVRELCVEIHLDPLWLDFNYAKIAAATDVQIIEGFMQALTTPFGNGDRLTWLQEVTIGQKCSELLLKELEAICQHLPTYSHLLLTASQKPDGRLKSTKLLQKYATVREFSPIAAWDTDAIATLVKQSAKINQVKLSPDAVEMLVESIGSDRRRLQFELEKLSLCYGDRVITAVDVAALVIASAHNSFQLGQALRQRQSDRALSILAELMAKNEPGIRLVATLTSQFRTWLWIKVMQEAGERDDKVVAEAAEIGNPKRLHFLKQEVKTWTGTQLTGVMSILLGLEQDLKIGRDELSSIQTAIILICRMSD
jgi:DNA polymerase III subunit delta